MVGARTKLNSSEIQKMLNGEGRYSGVRDDLRDRAERVLSAAQAAAPVDTGAYQASLEVTEDTTDRAAVRVGASVPYAMVVEADRGVLARALDAGS